MCRSLNRNSTTSTISKTKTLKSLSRIRIHSNTPPWSPKHRHKTQGQGKEINLWLLQVVPCVFKIHLVTEYTVQSVLFHFSKSYIGGSTLISLSLFRANQKWNLRSSWINRMFLVIASFCWKLFYLFTWFSKVGCWYSLCLCGKRHTSY